MRRTKSLIFSAQVSGPVAIGSHTTYQIVRNWGITESVPGKRRLSTSKGNLSLAWEELL
jgi:hypothetical protein